MELRGLFEIVLAAATTPVALWLYYRRTRPTLAYVGAKPVAFRIVVTCMLIAIFGSVVRLFDLLIEFPVDVDRALSRSGYAMAGGMLLFLLMGLVPGAVVRLTGGSDPSVAPRYLVNYYARWWSRDDFSPQRALGMVKWLSKHLEELKPPVDRSIVQRWIGELAAYRAAVARGPASEECARAHLRAELASVAPVDPFGGYW